jgi:hypothetical protein
VALDRATLHRRSITALGSSVLSHSELDRRPLELELQHPLPSKVRLYLFTLTHPPGGRTVGEHKIQIILPGQKRAERGELNFSGSRFVLLAGLEPEWNVFVLWDARHYRNIPHSRNVQVKAATVYEAYVHKMALQKRRLWGGVSETIVACTKDSLASALLTRFDLSLN